MHDVSEDMIQEYKRFQKVNQPFGTLQDLVVKIGGVCTHLYFVLVG